jgi:hypothetical protein
LEVYTDRDSVFVVNTRQEREQAHARGERPLTQVGRALKELGVRWIPAFSPQAKGRIERLWRTFQDRLLNELRLNRIRTLPEANRYLKKVFLPKYNRQFRRQPADPIAAWRPAPARPILETIFCVKETRTLGRDHTLSYQGKVWQVLPTPGVVSLVGRSVQVRHTLSGELQTWAGEKRLKVRAGPPTPPLSRAAASGRRRLPLARRLSTAGSIKGPRSPARKGGADHPRRRS